MPNTVCAILFIEPRETRTQGGMEASEHVYVKLCMYVCTCVYLRAFVYLQEKQAARLGCSSSCCAASPSVAASWSPVYMEGCHLWGGAEGVRRQTTKVNYPIGYIIKDQTDIQEEAC